MMILVMNEGASVICVTTREINPSFNSSPEIPTILRAGRMGGGTRDTLAKAADCVA